jgi:hypothetical protein
MLLKQPSALGYRFPERLAPRMGSLPVHEPAFNEKLTLAARIWYDVGQLC